MEFLGDQSRQDSIGATWFWPGETRVAALITELRVPVHAHPLDGNLIDIDSGHRPMGNDLWARGNLMPGWCEISHFVGISMSWDRR